MRRARLVDARGRRRGHRRRRLRAAAGRGSRSVRRRRRTRKLGKRELAKNDNAAALVEFQAALATRPGQSRRGAHRRRRGAISSSAGKDEAKQQALAGAEERADVRARAGPAAGGVGTELSADANPRRRPPRDLDAAGRAAPRRPRSSPRSRYALVVEGASGERRVRGAAPPVARRDGRAAQGQVRVRRRRT